MSNRDSIPGLFTPDLYVVFHHTDCVLHVVTISSCYQLIISKYINYKQYKLLFYFMYSLYHSFSEM